MTSSFSKESSRIEQFSKIKWPKSVTEQHVHVGGSVPLYRLWEIAIDRGIRGLGKSYEDFINLLKIQDGKVSDLDSYLEVYDRIELIQSGPAALRESIIIAIHRAYRTGGMLNMGPGGEGGSPHPLFNIGRLELRLNPLKRTGAVFLKGTHAGLYDLDRCIKSACDAVEEVELAFKGSIKVGLIFCFGRDLTPEANMILAEKTALWASQSDKIIAVDLAGHESINSLSDDKSLKEMKKAFDAVPKKLGRTAHIGETRHVELDTFIKTVNNLNPNRIGHPIVAFNGWFEKKDDRGLKLMKERGIVIEFCVKSNLLTRAVSSLKDYKKIITTADEFGLPYTFSTDAPSLQGTSLAEELVMLLESGTANEEQILRSFEVAERSSFIK